MRAPITPAQFTMLETIHAIEQTRRPDDPIYPTRFWLGAMRRWRITLKALETIGAVAVRGRDLHVTPHGERLIHSRGEGQ